jgi:serine/threonine protein kinase
LAVDPRLIPGFEIVGRLASGGVAQVFRARRESDDVLVALKVTSLGQIDPEFHPVERFVREARLLERINHPALPRLHGYGVTPDGLGWMALELVQGKPLSAYRGRPAEELVPIFIQVAEALQTVAQEGIVHRDVAPDNVLVEERGKRRQARLIDFGAAKDLIAGDVGALTRHGAFLGKLAYASPEQLVGVPKGESLDFRSDIYSLGMTMYELLAGRPAVDAQGLSEIVNAHVKGLFPPLVVPPERGGPATRLVQLVQRMTARRREDRPASWEEILAELWHSREEVSPLAGALAKKRSDAGLAPEPPQPPPPLPPGPEEVAAVAREVVIGRIVLAVGALAFSGALAFAIVYVRSQRPAVVATRAQAARPRAASPSPFAPKPSRSRPSRSVARAPEPTATPEPAAAEPALAEPEPTEALATAPPATHASVKRPTPRPLPTEHVEEARGVLEVALLPAGDLEEALDEGGRSVAPRQRLPARLELPPGRYRLRLVAPSVDCAKTVSVLVRAGRTASVRETCIEIK